jgi:hypothetical protein
MIKWKGAICAGALAVSAGVGATAWVSGNTSRVEAAETGIAPVMNTERLMKVFADPIAVTLKEAMKEAPATPKGWRIIQDQGDAAAEVANLTMLRQGEHEETPEWKQYALMMHQAGVALAEAAGKRDFAEVTAKYQGLVQSCNECHKKFEPDTAPEIIP